MTVKKTFYRVVLNGDVTIEAADEAAAITTARDFFASTGQNLTWAVSKVDVQVEPVAP